MSADARASIITIVKPEAIVGKFSNDAVVRQTIVVKNNYGSNMRRSVWHYLTCHREVRYKMPNVSIAIG